MKKIQLTQNKYTIVDDEDYIKLNKWNWHILKGKHTHYAVRRSMIMHREIMNCPNNKQVDHINGNGLDNRKENLRICNQSQNNANMRISKRNTSGYKGVSWHKECKKWRVRIQINSKMIELGRFSDINDAKNVYDEFSKKHFGEFHSDGIKKENIQVSDTTNYSIKEKIYANNTSGIRGVYYHKTYKKWVAKIFVNKKQKSLGYFDNINDAKLAYEKEINK